MSITKFKRFVLLHNGEAVSTSDNRSYLNRKMSDAFCKAVKDPSKPDHGSFFENQYARVGDETWAIYETNEK